MPSKRLPAYLAALDLSEPDSFAEPLTGRFWELYQPVAGPDIDAPSAADVQRYHCFFRSWACINDIEVERDWIVPRNKPDAEPVLAYHIWNTNYKDDDWFGVRMKELPRFTRKVRYVNDAKARRCRRKPKVVFRKNRDSPRTA
jgi:hypothetical protein